MRLHRFWQPAPLLEGMTGRVAVDPGEPCPQRDDAIAPLAINRGGAAA